MVAMVDTGEGHATHYSNPGLCAQSRDTIKAFKLQYVYEWIFMKCKLTRKLVAEVPTNNQPRNCERGRNGIHASRHNIYDETGKRWGYATFSRYIAISAVMIVLMQLMSLMTWLRPWHRRIDTFGVRPRKNAQYLLRGPCQAKGLAWPSACRRQRAYSHFFLFVILLSKTVLIRYKQEHGIKLEMRLFCIPASYMLW